MSKMEVEDRAAALPKATAPRSLDDVLRDPATAWEDVRVALRRRSVDAGTGTATHAGLLLALGTLGDNRGNHRCGSVAAEGSPTKAILTGESARRVSMLRSSLRLAFV